MFDLLSLLTGMIVAVMVAVNGGLTTQYGVFGAAVIIHIIGSAFAFLLLIVKRQPIAFPQKITWWLYTGGAIGVLTTAFYNFAYGKISLTGIVALGLLGQTVTSLLIDNFGLFGMRKYPFKKSTLIGLAFAAVGIFMMLNQSAVNALYAVAFSFFGGVTVVLSRTVNGGLAQHTGALRGSYINHIVGLPVTVAALFLLGRSDAVFNGFTLSSHWWIYLGGIFGVIIVLVFNIIVPKIPSFRLTLLAFIGQVFAGIVLDLITKQGYSWMTFFGGLVVSAGVGVNMLIEHLQRRKSAPGSDQIERPDKI
ncbi:MAG TPA: DMT family transporter [Oscillospiraceae bacterium]|nr:DMT family transporter [Oscillospiraceae bacterium]HPF55399.1 DMT family transporter [Clostridiales bacterium]HPK35611.1 DMT family transporter [Oscillospiraceae bacterium]HPR74675.1 DMT family transporter [Oscillospiraceae bacterium]